MNEHILEMKNISKRYGGIYALKNANLSLKAGEVLCLCGENGAGKSTLMKILAGAETPSEGDMYYKTDRFISAWYQYGTSGTDTD